MTLLISKRRGSADLVVDPLDAIWQQRAVRPGRRPPVASFDGRRVLTLESRRSPELALLVMNYGGTPVIAPSLREVPLESNHQALMFADELLRKRFGMIIQAAEQCEGLLRAKRCTESVK